MKDPCFVTAFKAGLLAGFEQWPQVARTMKDVQNLNAIWKRPVEDDVVVIVGNREEAQPGKSRIVGFPKGTQLRHRGKALVSLLRGSEKSSCRRRTMCADVKGDILKLGSGQGALNDACHVLCVSCGLT